MARCDIQLLVNTICYFAISICGFAISIPLGVITYYPAGVMILYIWRVALMFIKNSHLCILYINVEQKDSTNFWQYSKNVNCNFPVYTSVVLCILYGLVQGVYHIYVLKKSMTNPMKGVEMWVRPFIVGNAVCALFLFVASCLISVGFARTCQDITNYYKKKYSSFKCSDAQDLKITDPDTKNSWTTGKFYDMISVSQIASWICFLIWLILVFSSIIRYIRNRKLAASLASTTWNTTSDQTSGAKENAQA